MTDTKNVLKRLLSTTKDIMGLDEIKTYPAISLWTKMVLNGDFKPIQAGFQTLFVANKDDIENHNFSWLTVDTVVVPKNLLNCNYPIGRIYLHNNATDQQKQTIEAIFLTVVGLSSHDNSTKSMVAELIGSDVYNMVPSEIKSIITDKKLGVEATLKSISEMAAVFQTSMENKNILTSDKPLQVIAEILSEHANNPKLNNQFKCILASVTNKNTIEAIVKKVDFRKLAASYFTSGNK